MIETNLTFQIYGGPYSTGATISLPFHDGSLNAQFMEDDDIVLYHIDNTGIETLLTIGVEYQLNKTQNGGNGLLLPNGAYVSDEVEIITADLVAVDEELKILRDTDKTQEQQFADKSLEIALDKLTIITQELKSLYTNDSLSADIAQNTADIAQNTTNIGINVTDIATNAASIIVNAADILGNTTNITNNAVLIAAQAIQITDILSQIGVALTGSTWAGNDMSQQIESNRIVIGTIGYDALQVAQNTADIAQNTADIGSNAADILVNDGDIITLTADASNLESRVSDLEAAFGADYRYAGSVGIGNVVGWTDIDALEFNGSGAQSAFIKYELERRTEDPLGLVEMNTGIMSLFYRYSPDTDSYGWYLERNTFDGVVDTVAFEMSTPDALVSKIRYNAAVMTGANYYGKLKYQVFILAAGL